MFIYSQQKLSTFEDGEVVKCLLMVLLVCNATFNDISVISWWRVLLVEETEVPGNCTGISVKSGELNYFDEHNEIYIGGYSIGSTTTTKPLPLSCKKFYEKTFCLQSEGLQSYRYNVC
jgi:hypothetical protein